MHCVPLVLSMVVITVIQTPLFLASALSYVPQLCHPLLTCHSLARQLTSPSQALFSTIFPRQARKSSTNLALTLLTLPAFHCSLSTNSVLLHLLVVSSNAFLELIGRMLTISISSDLRPFSYCTSFEFAVLIHFHSLSFKNMVLN